MKKVGIITVHRIPNVGSLLQAYALQETIKGHGYNCEIIDYNYPTPFHKKTTIKRKIALMLYKPVKRVLGGGAFELSEQRFNDFLHNKLNLSSKLYNSIDELYDNPPDYDLYCAGSDQIWNPNYKRGDPVFFCDFAAPEKPIVSYSSSFGVSTIPEQYEIEYKKYLTRFLAISVREQSGIDIVRRLAGKDAKLVVDPTLLLRAEQWLEIAPKHNFPDPYILCYGWPYPNVYLEQMAMHIQKKTGFRIVYLFGRPWHRFNKKIKHIFDVGPLEFLNWINNAKLVLTISFHGTIFSANFRTPFYSIYPNEEKGTRQLNILDCLDLCSRAIKYGSEFPSTDFLEVDFDNAHSKLNKMRKDSCDYIKRMLSFVPKD